MGGAQSRPNQSPEVLAGHEQLIADMKLAFNDAKYSDLTIKCGKSSWKVHKVIVCPRSKFLEKACSGAFKEAKSSCIDLPDDNPQIIGEMLRYLYTADYDDEVGTGATPAVLLNVHMHTAAVKFDVPALAALAEKKFEMRCDKSWNSDAFADAIEELYTDAADPQQKLRIIALDVATAHAKDLYAGKEFGQKFRTMASEVPIFASELSAKLAAHKESKVECDKKAVWRCPNCTVGCLLITPSPGDEVHCFRCGQWSYGNSWAKQ